MSNPITNQKQQPTSVVEMDAGKFLHMINVGAQSQVTLFAERIAKLGEQIGAKWKLASLDNAQLVFEDVSSNTYFLADIKKLGRGNVKIENIRELRIIESKKEGSFRKNLLELIDAISESNTMQADAVFNRIAAQRFRSNVIPESGVVTTRDGVSHRVSVANTIVDGAVKPEIVAAICESVSDRVKVNRGRIVEATFGDATITIPINELTRRRCVARYSKEQAKTAYKHEGFQKRVQNIAALVSQDKVEEAIQKAAEMLMEEQQFCMLTQGEMQQLTNDTLATVGCMNSILADDVGSLLYRTNCRTNYKTIIDEWKQTARKSEYAPLVENVRMLAETKDFETDYQAFLGTVFMEDVSTQVAKAKMYLAALKDMRNILAGNEENKELAGSLDNYIVRLEGIGDNPDDAVLLEVEELVASVSEGLLKNLSDLKDYDKVPEPSTKSPEEFGTQNLASEPGEEAGGGPGGPALPLGEAEETEETPTEEEEPEIPLEGKKNSGKQISEAKTIADLDASQIKLELEAWKKNAEKFFAEDGNDSCVEHLKTCITRANFLKESGVANAFNQILAENTPLQDVEAEQFGEEDLKINKNYGLNEEKDKAVTDKNQGNGATGGLDMEKVSGKNCAMGKAGETDMNVSDGGHSAAILKGGGKKISDKKVASESIDQKGYVVCTECKGHFEPVICMTESGAACPECGADMSNQLMEALSNEDIKGCGHKMDRVSDGKGVAATTTTQSDGRSAGTSAQSGGVGGKQRMERVGKGNGIAATTATQSDGAKAGGKKDSMERVGGGDKGIAERQRQAATQGMRPRGLKKTALKAEGKETPVNESTTINVTSTDEELGPDGTTKRVDTRNVTFTTDKSVDEVVADIASHLDGGEIDGEAPPVDAGMGGPEIGGEEGAEGMPGPEIDAGAGGVGASGGFGGTGGAGPDSDEIGEIGEPGAEGEVSPEVPPEGAEGEVPPEGEAGGEVPPEFGGEGEGEAAEEAGEAAEEAGEAAEEAGEAAEEAGEEEEEEEEEFPAEGADRTGKPLMEKKFKGTTADGRKFKLKIGKKAKKEKCETCGKSECECEEEAVEECEAVERTGQPVTERKGPPAKFQFKKKGDKKGEEEEGEEPVTEDENVTTPQGEDYTSAKAARKDGGTGIDAKNPKALTEKPKFKESDGKNADAPARPISKKQWSNLGLPKMGRPKLYFDTLLI